MVLVDTSIWIDFLQAPESVPATALVALIKDHNRVTLCGIVLQEVLQGIRNHRSRGSSLEKSAFSSSPHQRPSLLFPFFVLINDTIFSTIHL